MIYVWCRQCGVQAEDAADIGQEVLAAVAKTLASFRRDEPGATFRGWLWTITRNKIRDFFRRHKDAPQGQGGSEAYRRLAELPDAELDSTFSFKPNDNRLEHQVVEIVRASVEEQTWQAFWLTAVEGREPADVAQSLGITSQAVYGAIYRVRRRIRQELEGLE
jgi:RNA polymerase sigma-70 factor (ECF subfamily)